MLTFNTHGKAVEMDMLLRQCLREFSHPHLPILYQMIASLAKTEPVCYNRGGASEASVATLTGDVDGSSRYMYV